MDKINIIYCGHACFKIEYGGQSIVLDPYGDGSLPGLPPMRLEASYVICSHGHGDHHFTEGVKIVKTDEPSAFDISVLKTEHDDKGGALRGMNDIHIIRCGDMTVVHFGDLGRDLSDDELAKVSGADCFLIPVGGYFTIDAPMAKSIIDRAKPKVTIPMHYRTKTNGLEQIANLEEFTKLCDNVEYGGNSFELTKDTEKKTVVLKYM